MKKEEIKSLLLHILQHRATIEIFARQYPELLKVRVVDVDVNNGSDLVRFKCVDDEATPLMAIQDIIEIRIWNEDGKLGRERPAKWAKY